MKRQLLMRLGMLLCLCLATWGVAMAQSQRITGTVLDERGVSLPGVSVRLQNVAGGAPQGAATDGEGKFNFAGLPDNAAYNLTFTMVGYAPSTISNYRGAANARPLVVRMAINNSQLTEVVVTGYGSKRKEDLTTAISSVKLDQTFKSRPSNVTSMLQGQLPGVTIQSAGGDPLKGNTISIRGRGSRGNDSNPASGDAVLYVVDGVPNAPFNIEDVETISVLKDAASAAIYGAYVGSGGVIVVTTKQAKLGKLTVDLNVNNGIKQAWRLPKVTSSEEYDKVVSDAMALDPTKNVDVANAKKYPYGAVTRTNWLDAIFRKAYAQHYSLGLSGGNEKTRAIGSFTYDKNEGLLLNTFNETIGAKASVDFQLTNWLKIGERATFQRFNGQGNINTSSHEGVIMNAVFFPPSATVYEYNKEGTEILRDAFGNPLYHGTVPTWAANAGITGYGEIRNPVATLNRLHQYQPTNTLYSTTSLEVRPVSNLVLHSDFTAGLTTNLTEVFSPRVLEIGRVDNSNNLFIANRNAKNYLWETTATYDRTFNNVHRFNALLGFTLAKDQSRYNDMRVWGFDREDDHFIVAGNASDYKKTPPSEDRWEEMTVSHFARLDYSYSNRYFITASVRRDATSKINPEHNHGFFPAVSGSWKISAEPFFEGARNTVSLLKLRASWGQIGNKALAPRYSYNVPLAQAPWFTFLGEQLQTQVRGKYQRSINNPDLRWETSEQTDVGLDMDLFKHFSLTADWYLKYTKDLIELIPVSSTAGIEVNPYGNIGKVKNTGFDVGARYNQTFNGVTVNAFANTSFVKNNVVSLTGIPFMDHPQAINNVMPLRSAPGQPWYSYYLYRSLGIFQTADEIANYTTTDKNGVKTQIQPGAKPGDLKFEDFNHDGKIDDNDRQFMGSYLPKITYSFGAGAAYKGFDFNAFFQGIGGVKVMNVFKAMGMNGRYNPSNLLHDVLNSWEYNKTSGVPRLSVLSDPNGNYLKPNSWMLENGSYLRLKNVTLGYSLPQSVMNSMHMNNLRLRVYFNGENLATFTKYSGFDPEVGNWGLDGGNYPVARTYTFGVNINF